MKKSVVAVKAVQMENKKFVTFISSVSVIFFALTHSILLFSFLNFNLVNFSTKLETMQSDSEPTCTVPLPVTTLSSFSAVLEYYSQIVPGEKQL